MCSFELFASRCTSALVSAEGYRSFFWNAAFAVSVRACDTGLSEVSLFFSGTNSDLLRGCGGPCVHAGAVHVLYLGGYDKHNSDIWCKEFEINGQYR